MAPKTEVNTRAPKRLRWTFSFEKTCSMGFGSGQHGGRQTDGICQGIAQLKKGDVRIFGYHLDEEVLVRPEFARSSWTTLWRVTDLPCEMNLPQQWLPWLGKTSTATLQRDRLTLLESIAETATKAPAAKVLT